MAQVFNHFSFLLFVVPVVLLLLFLLLRGKRSRLKQVAAITLLVIAVLGYFLLQPGSDSVEGSQAENLLATSQGPVLVEVYSDY